MSLELTKPILVTKLIEEAQSLANDGKQDHACQLSLKATQLFPRDIGAWHFRASTAPSLEERLVCLSRVYSLDPNFPHAEENMHQALQALLRQEPSLAYLDENEQLKKQATMATNTSLRYPCLSVTNTMPLSLPAQWV